MRSFSSTVLGVTRISGFFQPAQSLRNTIQNNFCRALSRRRGRLARKVKSCWRRARFSRMRSSRERKALITQPMRCRSHEIMAKIVSKHPSTNRWQLVHSPSAPGFDEGHLAVWANRGQVSDLVGDRFVIHKVTRRGFWAATSDTIDFAGSARLLPFCSTILKEGSKVTA